MNKWSTKDERRESVRLDVAVQARITWRGGQFDALTTDLSPQDQVLNLELGEHIRNGLARLPQEQRLAVVLYDVQGFSYEEIATIMNTSPGTVKSRLSRGRAQLRDYLLKQGTFGP